MIYLDNAATTLKKPPCVADAEYSSKCIGTGTQMSDLTKKLHRMTFLL